MHAVALTHAFVRAAEQAGMSDDEVTNLVSFLAEHPTAGQLIPGTGGCRKVRIGGRRQRKERRVSDDHVLHRGRAALVPDHGVLERRAVRFVEVRAQQTSSDNEGNRGRVPRDRRRRRRRAEEMGRKAFDKVAEGLNEALAIARGAAKPARLYVPAEIDIKAIRGQAVALAGRLRRALRLHGEPDKGLGAGALPASGRGSRLSNDHRARPSAGARSLAIRKRQDGGVGSAAYV